MRSCPKPKAAAILFASIAVVLVLGASAGLLVQPGAAAQAQPQTGTAAKASPGDEQVWQEFLAWFKAAPPGSNPFAFEAYAAELGRLEIAKPEIERRFGVIMRLFSTRTEGIEAFYDKTFSRPALTGKPEVDGFASIPSEFLVGAVKGLKPGRALDVGMGQGRNAVELARQGWTVTGFDISGEAVAAAARNAQAAGVRITSIKADYASFDFGRDAWDLVAMIFAWAPVDDPAFVGRIRDSLRPGGLVVFEHFVATPERPFAPMIRALQPGALRDCFAGFDIVSYEEVKRTGDWGGPDSSLVRMVARKVALAKATHTKDMK
jgi:2-polyprenyl-3-methyl-5-hydroxy-6-metoxy-1,4-benzoquinol methylase